MRLHEISGALAVVLAAGAAHAAPGCESAKALVGARACASTPHGFVVAADVSEAARIAGYATAGESRFQRYFGHEPPSYAVVEGVSAQEVRTLQDVGVRRVLPWLSPQDLLDRTLASVREGAASQARAAGLSDAQVADVVSKAEAAWRERNTADAAQKRDAGVIPHELGHLWYVELFWPGVPVDAAAHYGGPGPDWMDETAAILLESDELADDRREQFASIYAGEGPPALDGASVSELTDLASFLHRDHPLGASASALVARRTQPGSKGPSVTVLTGAEAKAFAGKGALFYLQSRLVADFLIGASGDPTIFEEIGAAFARGQTIEDWLRARGNHHHLGASVAEMQTIWDGWLVARQGQPQSRTAT